MAPPANSMNNDDGGGIIRKTPTRTSSYQTKGNTGVSAQRRQRRKIMIWIVGTVVILVSLRILYYSRFAGYWVPNEQVDPLTGTKRTRRRPERHYQKLHPDQPTQEIDAILEGQLTLVDIHVPPAALQGGRMYKDDDARQPGPYDNFGLGFKYDGVTATFCHIDWKLQHHNPSEVAMFRDLQAKSRLCDATSITVDLYDIVQQSKQFDAKFGVKASAATKSGLRSRIRPKQQSGRASVLAVPPTGVVFHETRCGSTLMANLLASIDPSSPSSGSSSAVRVYSESPPPLTALGACDNVSGAGGGCNPKLHRQLIRDVFYMMGRRPLLGSDGKTNKKKKTSGQDQERQYHVFYKIQSIGVMNIDKFTSAFPTTPWVYMYRDTVEVMQSHWGKSSSSSILTSMVDKRRRPVCARNFGNRRQPSTTLQVIQWKVDKSVEELDAIEYCAAHLAGLSLSALQEHERNVEKDGSQYATSRFINYSRMPSIVWEDVLPNHFGVPVTQSMIGKMKLAATLYSKGRGEKANQEWAEDSTKKQNTASSDVIKASQFYVGDIYTKMERLSKDWEGK